MASHGTEVRGIEIRDAIPEDAMSMSRMLERLVAAGKRTNRADLDHVRNHYLGNPHRIACFVAVDAAGAVLGFQSLSHAVEGNPYDAPVGWAVIGTHICPTAARRGIGRALFERTQTAAEDAGVPAIEAFIGADNAEGQAYYEAMGFRTYRTAEGAVCKSYELGREAAKL